MSDPLDFLQIHQNGILIHLYIQPNAKQSEVIGIYQDRLKIKLNAPAVDGKANKGLIEFLSNFFEVPRSKIKIVKGQKSKIKTIAIVGMDIEIVEKKILNLL